MDIWAAQMNKKKDVARGKEMKGVYMHVELRRDKGDVGRRGNALGRVF